MLPDFSIRLNNLVKAMEKTIQPAIDPENGLAQEQAALVVGHLKMLEQQSDGLYLYERRCFENMLALAEHLAFHANGNSATDQAAELLTRAINSLPATIPMTVSGVNSLTITLGNGIDDLINSAFQDGSEEFKSLLTETLLDYNSMQSARERIWFRANNLDPDPSDLASMDEMLLTDRYKFVPAGDLH